jgi:ssDNA-binding Zn-finger/Zn-ribbon topoisomerase 1
MNEKKPQRAPVAEPQELRCPKCQSPLWVRMGARGPVWVCWCKAKGIR